MQQFSTHHRLICLSVGIALLLSGCITHKELTNFNEGQAFPLSPEVIANIPEIKIQPDDVLAISVQTLFSTDPSDVTNINAQGGNIPGNNLEYLVDNNGYIDFPIVGSVKLQGLSIGEAKGKLTEALKEYLQNPVVNIRYKSFKFTILGEVRAPATYVLAEERVSILDALGSVGDLTNYADRADILIIREQDGKRLYGQINLYSRQLFQSPYYYLQPNDIIYVKPLKEKVGSVTDQFTRVLPWIGIGTTVLNLIIILSRN